jgi:hypothetical protein
MERLVKIGVLAKTDGGSPWCAPSFCISKKDGRIRFITDFRELNKAIVSDIHVQCPIFPT